MNDNYTLLILGNLNDNHLLRFTKYLKGCNPDIKMDYFGLCDKLDAIPEEYIRYFDNCCIYGIPKLFHSIPGLRSLGYLIAWRLKFGNFIKNKRYDIANIHYISYHYISIIGLIRKSVSKIVITPWGSDVYRIKGTERTLVHRIYSKADYVTGHGDRFSDDFMRLYHVGKEKFKNVTLGSETIDYIEDHRQGTSTEDAKTELGIANSYAITCGYNASKAQRHKDIINAIFNVKDQLPNQLVLIFPLTYPNDSAYRDEIKQLVEEKGLNAVYYESYLDMNTLFFLRQATDMFVHVQTTDANNASLKEYLLCKKKVVNGGWLKYYDVETENYRPYYIVDNMGNLGDIILQAYRSEPIEISENVFSTIRSMGWREVAKEWNALFKSIT